MIFPKKGEAWGSKRWIVIIALCLAFGNIWQFYELYGRHRKESLCNEYKQGLLSDNDIISRSVTLSRKSQFPMSDEDYYLDTWPSIVDFPNETCVGLRGMGISGSQTLCFDTETKKLIRAFNFPHEGPPAWLHNGGADDDPKFGKRETSYLPNEGNSFWPIPKASGTSDTSVP
ncbi:hypothetical protein HRJ34_26100 [Rhizorhabdus wittichii]|uniref:Uncharacterized protein n=1 Tax=Rhizorhabdus wittichii TaxID=160791 RepID=A0A975D2L2_9SPHN|nr:hypothetical protein [Rhizorhabdus wittichii]QTH21729.1 hypothetical protein HRJ34_26100 [Rhizorhabdus wittichii]